MKRILFMGGLLSAFVFAWQRFEEIPLLVVGQPASSGRIQSQKEEPFFHDLSVKTGLPLRVDYRPVDSTGFKDTYQLQMLKNDVIDLASLRFTQNSTLEPGLQGMDLLGIISGPKDARSIMTSYSGILDQYLQANFNSKLLGIWTFGPQELFCNRPIKKLLDVKGLNVRVASPALSTFVSRLGGRPVIVPFEETKASLASGLLDCAITSAASANFAGWPQFAKYNFPIATQTGVNGYVISLKKWNRFSSRERINLQKTFDAYIDEVWRTSETLSADAASCNSGGACKFGTPYDGERVAVSSADLRLFRKIIYANVFPEWSRRCEKIHPGCRNAWNKTFSTYWHGRKDVPSQ